jgi:hypothetical protein
MISRRTAPRRSAAATVSSPAATSGEAARASASVVASAVSTAHHSLRSRVATALTSCRGELNTRSSARSSREPNPGNGSFRSRAVASRDPPRTTIPSRPASRRIRSRTRARFTSAAWSDRRATMSAPGVPPVPRWNPRVAGEPMCIGAPCGRASTSQCASSLSDPPASERITTWCRSTSAMIAGTRTLVAKNGARRGCGSHETVVGRTRDAHSCCTRRVSVVIAIHVPAGACGPRSRRAAVIRPDAASKQSRTACGSPARSRASVASSRRRISAREAGDAPSGKESNAVRYPGPSAHGVRAPGSTAGSAGADIVVP